MDVRRSHSARDWLFAGPGPDSVSQAHGTRQPGSDGTRTPAVGELQHDPAQSPDGIGQWGVTLERAGRPVLGLDGTGRVCALGPGAESLLGEALRVRCGHLAAADPLMQPRIAELVRAAIGYDCSAPEPMPPPVVLPLGPERSLHVDALPLPPTERGPASALVALVLLREAADGAGALAGTLKARFGLTPAEQRLAVALADGTGLREAAGHLGICLSTARAQLKAIFAKTGTHRQAELVALLARLN